ncbi:MAG: DegV family protein [Coriobacteriia bacterium]
MRRVGIVTDGTSDITPECASAFGIEVVPLTVTIGEETFQDRVLTQTDFFEHMNAAPSLPTTSLPSVGVFAEAYRSQLEQFSEAVAVHISSALSGTIEAAREAAKEFGGRVKVFDTRNLSWGEVLQAIEAAKAAASGTHRRATFSIMHAMSPDKVAWLDEQLRATYEVEDMYHVEAGAVICAHTGTGWGVALLPVD